MDLVKIIKQAVDKVVDDLGLEKVDHIVEHPVDMEHGDYACNVGMKGFDRVKDKFKSPRELAEAIVGKLKADKNLKKIVSEIKVAGPGFINISIQTSVLVSLMEGLLNGGREKGELKGKVMVEFTDPNPFKEFHIGHLYSNIVGESLSRIFEAQGVEVKRANYQGDVGMHVAKSIWGMKKLMIENDIDLNSLNKKSSKERQKFMGQAYVLGASAYEKDKNVKKEIEELNKKIYELDEEIKELYEKGRKWSLEYFEMIYQRLGTKFDYYFFEREVGEEGLKIVKKAFEKGVFEKSEGAVVYKGEKDGLHTRVFINKMGLPTYEAKDLGLAVIKYDKFKYDWSYNVTGNEINEYFKVVLAVLKKINVELWKKTRHIGHGMVRLPEGKMSSRTGKIMTGEWLLDEAKKQALKIMEKSKLTDKDEAAEMIGKAAVKYALLRNSIGQDIVFDFASSVSFEGNSGPYLQYTYARTRSVLSKARLQGQTLKVENLSKEEMVLLRTMYKFTEVIEEAAKELAPSNIASFLYDLAQKYNGFYNKHSILKAKTKEDKQFRLKLTEVTAEVIKKGLYLLGIEAPEKM